MKLDIESCPRIPDGMRIKTFDIVSNSLNAGGASNCFC